MTTDVRSLILDTARRLFGNLVTPEVLSAATKGTWAKELWSRLEENGFTAVDEDGLTFADGLALLQIAGYYATPVPLAESILATKILADLGIEKPDGMLSLGLNPDGDCVMNGPHDGACDANGASGISGSGASQSAAVSISGRWRDVPWAREADAVLLCATAPGGKTVIALVGKGDFEVEEHTNLAAEPLDVVKLDRAEPIAYAFIEESQQDVLLYGALTRVMQGAGALERVLDMTIQYAAERNQFGRPIAKFQAVQQQIAQMASETAAFRAAANRALKAVETLEEATDGLIQIAHRVDERGSSSQSTGNIRAVNGAEGSSPFGIKVILDTLQKDVVKSAVLAKIRLAQASLVSPTHAHQVHGAMGFTEEYTLHHYTRRVWSYRHEHGNERFWGKVLLSILGDEDVWEFVTE